jgi:hypothetical protein
MIDSKDTRLRRASTLYWWFDRKLRSLLVSVLFAAIIAIIIFACISAAMGERGEGTTIFYFVIGVFSWLWGVIAGIIDRIVSNPLVVIALCSCFIASANNLSVIVKRIEQ